MSWRRASSDARGDSARGTALKKRLGFFLAGGVIALILLGVLVGMSNLGELREHVAGIQWSWLVVAAAASLASYAANGGVYHQLLAGLGHQLRAWTVVRAVMVAMVVNRNLRSGGATGVATLSWLLSPHGVPASAVVSSAISTLLLTNSLFAGLFLAGVAAVGLTQTASADVGSSAHFGVYAGLAGGFTTAIVVAWLALARPRLRRRWMSTVEALASWVGRSCGRAGWGALTRDFVERAAGASLDLVVHRRSAVPAWALSVVRLATSVGALWLCFRAAGVPVTPAVLVLGYTAGKAAGVVSFIPAGLGLVEGSMVSVFAAFGVDLEAALVAVLLNRAVYHFLPAVVALALAGPLLRRVRAKSAETRTG